MSYLEIVKTQRVRGYITKFGLPRLVCFVSLFLLSQYLFGKIKLPSIISNNMVLQQQSGVPLWGNATANHKVSVITSWNHKQYTTQSDADGKWKVKIQTPRAGGPYTITFNDGDKLIIKNVLVGEVWICSGQSNMHRPMVGALNQPILHSNDILMHANNSQLRLFHVKMKPSFTPLDDCEGSWQLSSPLSAGTFSAVGFQFAKKMQELLKVPVGIIEASWGGTNITTWMNKKSLQSFPQIKIASRNPPSKNKTTCLFNGMIHPIAGYGIKGFIWYQGEANRHRPSLYKDLMVAMVSEWREVWGMGLLPFYYVQIAPYQYPSGKLRDSVPYVREAQALAMKEIPHSGMVVSMDVGGKHELHPPDKTTIAKRLLYWALGDAYHWEGVSYQSPSFKSMKINGDKITVSFDYAPLGLTSFNQKIKGFELAGNDREFYPAEANITDNGEVIIHSDEVPQPVAARYLFKDWAKGNLYNTAGLPVGPFRTDNW